MNKKALTDVIWMIILGLLVFILVSCSIVNGGLKAFNSYKNSEKSLQSIIDASKSMSQPTSRVQLTLVNLKMDEGTAIYVFTSKDDLIQREIDFVGGNDHSFDTIVKKPIECSNINDCICLCKDFSKKTPKDDVAEALKKKYSVGYSYEIACGKGIECYSLDTNPADKVFQEKTELEKIVTASEFTRVKDDVPRVWEGGFSFMRNQGYGEQLIRTQFTDLYVIKNTDGTIGYCFDDKTCAPLP
jgi:hypothetical protein